MKKLSIFLCIVMIMAMLPTMGVYADYQGASDRISFADFRGENTDQFGITKALALPEKVEDADGNEFNVTWSSSNTNAISISEEASDGNYIGTVTRGVADEWVTVTAKVEHDTKADTFVTRNYAVRVLADDEYVDSLLSENFEDKTITENNSDITDTTVSNTDWYFNGTNVAENNRTDYKFVQDETSGKVLKMTGKTSVDNSFAVRKLTESLPESGLVSYSINIKFASQNPAVIIRPFARQMSISSVTSFSTSGDSATFPSSIAIYNNWINLTTIYDVESKIAKVYANGIFMFEEQITSAMTYMVWDEIRLRMVNGANETVYVDNIEVKEILKGAADAVKEFNPATKGGIYVDENLPKVFEGMAVSYESSDEAVIATDGTVTRSEFFKTVSVTPVVKTGDIVLRGNTYSLTVLPKAEYYKERLYEDFTAASIGKIFGEDGTATYNAWSLSMTNSSYNTYDAAIKGGVKTEIESVDGNNALFMEVPLDKKGYRLVKTVNETLTANDRVVLSMRVKTIGAGTMTLSNPYMGTFNNVVSWGGNWNGNSFAGVDNILIPYEFRNNENWHTYLFVFDRSITEKKGTDNIDANPISLYIDGKYVGTQWENASYVTSYVSSFPLFQNNVGYTLARSIYVDDILLAKIDIPEIQFTGATVTDGTVDKIGVQYISYGTQNNMTAMLAAYNGNSIIGVKKLWTDTDSINTGYNEIDVEDYQLPDGTTSYRLFLFDSLDTLIPVAISKEYTVK